MKEGEDRRQQIDRKIQQLVSDGQLSTADIIFKPGYTSPYAKADGSNAVVKKQNPMEGINILSGRWKECSLFVECIAEWKCRSLKLYCNEVSQILREIQDIKFSALIDINISTNLLESIEGLERIYMPHLQFLWLWINYICQFRPLAKCNFPKLLTLDLKQNVPLQYQCLSELHSPLLSRLDLHHDIRNKKKPLVSCQLMKIQTTKINSFTQQTRDGLKRLKDFPLNKRFPGLH